MALKDTLLAGSLGVTIASCHHADFQDFQPETMKMAPHHLKVSNPETQEQLIMPLERICYFMNYYMPINGKQALIACRGNYAKAQQRMVGERIKKRMGEKNTDWSNTYNTQAIVVTQQLCNMGKISRNGNKTAYNRMLKYYRDRYNIKARDIMNMNFTSNQQMAVNILKKDMDKYNAYSDTNRQPVQSIHRHHDSGR